MTLTVVVVLIIVITIGVLVAIMFAQRPVSSVQKLIQQHRYEEAASLPAADSAGHLHRAEALKLMGRFEEAEQEYRLSHDPAAREGLALAMAHRRSDLATARRIMEETMTAYPAIQEFQALSLAYILLQSGQREEALRLFRDNLELLETRFKDDYTDPDPLLAETLYLFAELTAAAGDLGRAGSLRRQAAVWAPGSIWERGLPSRSSL